MTTLLLQILGCVLVALIAVGLHAIFRRKVNHLPPSGYNDVTAAVYATFGVLYAIILGLLVGHGQSRRDMVSEASIREASLLIDITEVASSLDDAVADSLGRACLLYADHVRGVEWSFDANDGDRTIQRVHLSSIWGIVRSIEPSGARQESVYRALLGLVSDLATQRYRRHAAMGDHLSPLLQVMLITGGLFTILFLWFFRVEHHRLHLTYTWLVTFMVVLVLALIFALDDPLRPGVGIEPSDFEHASAELRIILRP
jgi:hypothetical protein